MPYKDKQKQLANNRLWKQNKKNMMNPSVEIPRIFEEIPHIPSVEIPRIFEEIPKLFEEIPKLFEEIPILSEEPSEVFFHDNRRFELLYDVMTLREMMMKRTNFNIWMNRHLGVLDELHLKKN